MSMPLKLEQFGGLDRYHSVVHKQPSARVLTNLYTDGLSLRIRKGQVALNSEALAAADIQGMHFYRNAAGTEHLLAICNGVLSKLTSVGAITPIETGLGTSPFQFAQFGDNAYFCDGNNVNGVYKYDGGTAALLTAITKPSSAAILAPECVEIDDCDTVANWSTSDATNFVLSQDTSIKMEGTGSIKIIATAEECLGDTLTRDLGAGNELNLSGVEFIRLWIWCNKPGPILKFGFGESAWNEHTSTINVQKANYWEEHFIDISHIADTSRNTARYFGFECLDESVGFTFRTDYLTYSGGLNGEYSYRWTYYDSTSGVESNPSDSSAVRVRPPENQSIKLTGFSASGEADKIRIYRQGGVDFCWRLVAEIADTATEYVDSQPHYLLGDIQEPWKDPPPKVSTLCWANSHMFYGGNPSYPNRVYVSNFEDPTITPPLSQLDRSIKYGGTMDAGSSENKITVLKSYAGNVLVYSKRSTHIISGDSFQTFTIRSLFDSIGCTAPQSLAGQAALYWLYESKVYRYNGSTIEDMTTLTIGPDLEALTQAVKEAAVGIYFDKRYYIFFNTTGYVFDERSGAWSKIEGWNVQAAHTGAFEGEAETLWFGDNAGYVQKSEQGTTDNDTAISFDWQSFSVSAQIETVKQISQVELIAHEPTEIAGYAVYNLDHLTEKQPASTIMLPGQTIPKLQAILPSTSSGTIAQVGFEGNTVKTFEVHGLALWLYEQIARA